MRNILAILVGAGVLSVSTSGWGYAATPVGHGRAAAVKTAAVAPKVAGNPLLPAAIPVESFFIDLGLVAKNAAVAPAGFEPLYSAGDWAAYEKKYGAEELGLPRKKSSGQVDFAKELIAAATGKTGLDRLMLLRAAIVAYRNKDGFTTADKAVAGYQKIMDVGSVTQMGALWTIGNAMARTIATPRAERVRYDGIAARANMQLTILLMDADQVDAAQAMIKMIAYHEGWVRSDKKLTAEIAQVRAEVHQTVTTMDYLATQYQPAINGDDAALMAVYLYGRFVKGNEAIVADLPGRKPSSPMAQLASALSAAERGNDPLATYTAADMLKTVASGLPDGVLKQRTLYASLENYRAFIASPLTERERIKRTLARMAIEGVIADGARAGTAVHPFEAVVVAEATTRPGGGGGGTTPGEPVPPGKDLPLKPVPPGTQPSPVPVPLPGPEKPPPLPPGKGPSPELPGKPGSEPETPIM